MEETDPEEAAKKKKIKTRGSPRRTPANTGENRIIAKHPPTEGEYHFSKLREVSRRNSTKKQSFLSEEENPEGASFVGFGRRKMSDDESSKVLPIRLLREKTSDRCVEGPTRKEGKKLKERRKKRALTSCASRTQRGKNVTRIYAYLSNAQKCRGDPVSLAC